MKCTLRLVGCADLLEMMIQMRKVIRGDESQRDGFS
jgi:hypothetical protein